MTDTSPWSDVGPDGAQPTNATRSKKSTSALMIIVILLVGFGVGGLTTWIVNRAALVEKERDRARAVEELKLLADKEQAANEQVVARAKADIADMAIKLGMAETVENGAKKLIGEAQDLAANATRQASEASRQLGDARKEASSLRAERDEARSLGAVAQSDMDKMKMLDANPSALPTAALSKAIYGINAVRCSTAISCKTPVLGVTEVEAKNQLGQALTKVGLNCAEQSPVEMMLLVSFSEDQPRRALGVMLLVTRVMKVPGEALSKQSAVWGQQRISLVNDASAATQLEALIQELVTAMNLDLGPATATAPLVAPTTSPTTAPTTKPASAPTTAPIVAPPKVPPANGKP